MRERKREGGIAARGWSLGMVVNKVRRALSFTAPVIQSESPCFLWAGVEGSHCYWNEFVREKWSEKGKEKC